MELDMLVYPPHLRGSFDEIYGRFTANRDIFVLLFDKGKIIGYLCFFPVKDDLYERILAEDKLFDSDISAEMIESYKSGRTYKLFLISAAIHPEYQRKGLSRRLLEGFHEFLQKKNGENIGFSTALAAAVSPAGAHMCQKLGFAEIKRLPGDYILYELSLDKFSNK
jgi:GNAT superfamily N-acetyltransferase